ncbi:MAG: amidohydrolase [Deinococcota bacterium]
MRDTLFINGDIITMQAEGHTCEALAVRAGIILAVGSEADVREQLAPNPEVIDLQGACLLPGFHDSHVHLTRHGFELDQLRLDDAPTLESAQQMVKDRLEQTPAGSWILGSGFATRRWGLTTLTRQQLDVVAPNHPVALESQDHHSAWLNTAALRQLSIDASTPDPEHGTIVREDDGQPSGMLLERAMYLVRETLDTPDDATIQGVLVSAANDLARYGITSVHHMAAEPNTYWRQHGLMAARPDYALRVWSCIPQEDADGAVTVGVATGQGGDRFQVGGAKFFADGALGTQTALMLAPYDGSENVGTVIHSKEFMLERFPLVIEAGLTPVIHAIGDAANRMTLDVLEATAPLWRAKNLRPRIEHAQHLNPDDLARFASLGVIASVQPIHMVFDAPTMPSILGVRSGDAYRFKSLLASGARVVMGSDTPIASPDVITGIRAAVTRNDNQGNAFYPDEALSVYEVLSGYTKDAAYAIHREDSSGQLKPGFDADLVMLSHSPFVSLDDLQIKGTMLAGRWT